MIGSRDMSSLIKVQLYKTEIPPSLDSEFSQTGLNLIKEKVKSCFGFSACWWLLDFISSMQNCFVPAFLQVDINFMLLISRAQLRSAHQGQPLPNSLSILESTPQVRGLHAIIRLDCRILKWFICAL